MKLRVLRGVLGVGGAVVGLCTAVGATAATATDERKPAATPPAKSTPAVAVKKEEPMGKVEGIEVKRGAGYFGIALVSGNFKITFYDAKRHVVPAPVNRAVLHWPVNYRPTDDRTVLNLAGDGKSLSSPKIVKPPYVFKLFITFLSDGVDEAVSGGETYTIDFKA